MYVTMLEVVKQPAFEQTGSDCSTNPVFTNLKSRYNKMPVDFASYLLSASPPGFELHYTLRDHFGFNPHGYANRNGALGPLRPIIGNRTDQHEQLCNNLQDPEEEQKSVINDVDEPYHNGDDDCHFQLDDDFVQDFKDNCNLNSSNNASEDATELATFAKPCPKLDSDRKKVSFADENGLALVSVRILTESSDTPPYLRPDILSSLAGGASARVAVSPPLVLNFSQPASDYIAFREKLEKNFVCLENVILQDYSLVGTIKVKNIAFHKTVKVRATFDSWQTSTDVMASYVDNSAVSGGLLDTFSFTLNVPPNLDVRKKVQFAVMYAVEGREFWDNNNGLNYEVVSADWSARCTASKSRDSSCNTTDGTVFSTTGTQDWASYSGWHGMDSSVPYY